MTVYVESSAVLAWLLGEPPAASVRRILAEAERVVTSDLTLVECDRTIFRAVHLGSLTERRAEALRRVLRVAETHWSLVRLGREVVAKAREAFPGPPVRTLDALHLGSMLVIRDVVPELTVLTLDERVRGAGMALGFPVVPLR
ncbi:MAG TPA: type II toxin-antitoxin system VapC family toxin [Candidatus Tectomicrobia bacterium]|nr:type II toxin-antitoxin system VapC family toxin [Candidatus Tectomicrobia bacterium]